MPDTPRTIHYKFEFKKSSVQEFDIHLDNATLDLVQEPKETYPAWAKLNVHKCSNCPLDEKEHEYCPVAAKLARPMEFFSETPPSNDAHLSIETPERTYSKNTDVQSAVVSILGIHMAASGCPILDKLRPTVRFHLPFTNNVDTTYRTLANYLIAQFLLNHTGEIPDWELKNLTALCERIAAVQQDFRERLKEIDDKNYARNCLVKSESCVNDINMSLDNDALKEIEDLFDDGSRQGPAEPLSYQYQFYLGPKETKEFTINIDRKTLRYVSRQKAGFPDWTQLQNNKCPNCPLNEKEHQHCPAATAISETIEFFRKTLSIEQGMITIKSANRDYSKKATISDGISAMIGLVMASSGCPILSRLKPLVQNHLPFGTQEETAYRSLGMHFLSQHCAAKNGQEPRWSLDELTKLYEEINTVNKAFCVRLRESGIEDASLNALVKLDCFAHIINFELSKGKIEKLQRLFEQYNRQEKH